MTEGKLTKVQMASIRFNDVIECNDAFWVVSWWWLNYEAGEVGTEVPCFEDGKEAGCE